MGELSDADRLVRHTRPHHKNTCVTINVPQDCIDLERLGDGKRIFIRLERDGTFLVTCNHMGAYRGDGRATFSFNEFHAAITQLIMSKEVK